MDRNMMMMIAIMAGWLDGPELAAGWLVFFGLAL
jgi:hypothetical protein